MFAPSKRPDRARTRLLVLAVLAVVIPISVLSVLQFSSLSDLEKKTRVAVRQNLSLALDRVVREAEEELQKVAHSALDGIGPEMFDRPDVEGELEAILDSHSGIETLLFVSHCSCREEKEALLYSSSGLRRAGGERFENAAWVDRTLELYRAAESLATNLNRPGDIMFLQSNCSLESDCRHKGSLIYAFVPIVDPRTLDPVGFSALSLHTEFVKESLLPQLLAGADSATGPDERAGAAPVLAFLDEAGRDILGGPSQAVSYEVERSLAPVFPKWKVAAGYRGLTVDALASQAFNRNLVVAVLAVLALIGGVALTLRATTREMRLADAKSNFVSNVSHELKTPLALIRLFSDTLRLGRVEDPRKVEEYMRIISSESRRLTQLINNILDFSRIEANRKEYRRQEADVAEVVEEALTSYEYAIQQAGFSVTREIAAGLPGIRVDREAISQAFLNLVHNAVKYSKESREIVVRVFRSKEEVAIQVVDKGIGIASNERRKIFDKFYRVSDGLIHDTKGSGLGLALVKHIVDAHQGRIEVKSRLGEGSTFTLFLPFEQPARSKSPKREPIPAIHREIAESPHR